MLSTNRIDDVKGNVCSFWQKEVHNPHFTAQAQGKEIGHRIADYVDEKTTSFIHAHYPVAFERNAAGKKKMRSMGDLWLNENNIYHPINIKTGMTNSGQPNMVSLGKLLKCLLNNQIDSYYLLMVKFTSTSEGLEAPEIYFLDMLEYLGYLTFDSGPGQIMLQAESFFQNFTSIKVGSRSSVEKIEFLINLLEEGDRRLIANRKQRHDKMQNLAKEYMQNGVFSVSPDDQKPFNLK